VSAKLLNTLNEIIPDLQQQEKKIRSTKISERNFAVVCRRPKRVVFP